MAEALAVMRFLTIGEVAEVLGVSPATVYNMIKRGQIKIVRVGRSIRIPETSLLELAGSASEWKPVRRVK